MKAWVALTLLGMAVPAAARPTAQDFNRVREEIRLLALERLRVAPEDPRTLPGAESRLRALHEDFQVQGGTPPVRLSADLGEIRAAGQRFLRQRTAGHPVAADPRATRALEAGWALYNAQRDALLESVAADRAEEKPESAAYWAALGRFDALKEKTQRDLLNNAPPGEAAAEDRWARDRATLLAALEFSPRKTRRPSRALVPEERPLSPGTDLSAFYRAVDSLPDARPLAGGVFSIPAGARTVTQRRAGLRLVLRPSRGTGVAHVGAQEIPLDYRHLVIAPETPFYIENTGALPLEIEFLGLKP